MNRKEKIELLKRILDKKEGVLLNHGAMSNDEKLKLSQILRRIRESTGSAVQNYYKLKHSGATEEEILFINGLRAKYSIK